MPRLPRRDLGASLGDAVCRRRRCRALLPRQVPRRVDQVPAVRSQHSKLPRLSRPDQGAPPAAATVSGPAGGRGGTGPHCEGLPVHPAPQRRQRGRVVARADVRPRQSVCAGGLCLCVRADTRGTRTMAGRRQPGHQPGEWSGERRSNRDIRWSCHRQPLCGRRRRGAAVEVTAGVLAAHEGGGRRLNRRYCTCSESSLSVRSRAPVPPVYDTSWARRDTVRGSRHTSPWACHCEGGDG
mmetsp:Transcript_36973/g.96889  ORF Transcript_36973/g.96889 Transcript_36973/m.96889 type:complete len:239 (-) Transcript_36973:1087-1803(-)